MPMLETDIYAFSFPMAALATSIQLAALLKGAEMGKIKTEGMSEQQEKATNAVQRIFAVALGATLPLQA